MVDLPSVPERLTLLEQPRTSVSASDVAGPGMAMAGAFQNASQAIDEGMAPIAEQAGRDAVVRNPDGSVSMQKIPVFGRLGEIYNHTSRQAFEAQTDSSMTNDLADLARKTMLPVDQGGGGGDPSWFEKTAGAYVKQRAGNQRGGMQTPVLQQGALLIDQYARGLQTQKFAADTQTTKATIGASIDDQKSTMFALARQGGTDTPEFQEAVRKYTSLLDTMVNDPRMGMSKDMAQMEVEHTVDNAKAFGIVGMVDRTFKTEGRAAAQKVLTDEILNNPNAKLSDAERQRAYSWGMSRLEYLNGENKAQIDAHRQTVSALTDAFRTGHPPGDTVVDAAIKKAQELGDAESVMKIEAERRIYDVGAPAANLPDDKRLQVMTRPPTASAPSPLLDLFSQKEQQHGLPAGYLGRTASIETGGKFDTSAVNKDSGASGLFQFVRSTARQYKVDPFDVQSSTDGAARLAADNARGLRTALGREPTGADLYLAHQQGVGGAAKLLSNPDALAASLVGTKAVVQNGGRQDMTAREFTAMWQAKFDGRDGPAPDVMASNGTPFTQQEVDNNPFLVSAWVRSQVNDERGMVATASRVSDAIIQGLKNGNMPDPNTVAAVVQVGNQFPEKLADKVNEIEARIRGSAAGQEALNADTGSGEAMIRTIVDKARQGGNLMQVALAEQAQKSFEAGQTAMRKDPFSESARRGWVPRDPAPLPFGGTNGEMAAALQERSQASIAITAHDPSLGPLSALRPDEKTRMGTFLESAPADQVVSTLAMMGQTLSPDVMAATMRDLYGNERARPYVVAAYFTDAGQPQTAQNIVVGERILAQKPDLVQDKFKSGTALDTPSILPVSLFAPGVADTSAAGGGKGNAYSDIVTIAKSIYAAKKGVEGTKDYDPALWKAALTEASGGIVYKTTTGAPMAQAPRGAGNATPMTYGDGQAVIAPRPGMTQAEFSARLITIRDEVFANMAVGSGEPITRQDFMDHAQLQALGSGQYAVMLGNGAVADIRTGKPFVLDLR